MTWWQALLLGIVQGLTEFLPVSSSGHLVLAREILGVDAEGFMDFTLTVHFATVLSTMVVFWGVIWSLLKGLFKFRYNEETDYILKIAVSMIPIGIVGVFFKDSVESLFGDSVHMVCAGLVVTAALLLVSDFYRPKRQCGEKIGWWQAIAMGLGQAVAVIPGISRSGTTIATGLCCGMKRENIAQFSFLMVLPPIIGEQLLDILDLPSAQGGVSWVCLVAGFVGAFASGLLACKAMIAIVKKCSLRWFAAYCAAIALIMEIYLLCH